MCNYMYTAPRPQVETGRRQREEQRQEMQKIRTPLMVTGAFVGGCRRRAERGNHRAWAAWMQYARRLVEIDRR
jgi:hypothetical protein